ncbi:MAG: hypothetical protein ABI338_03590, partial [Gemmatimonadaceae bacterium]
WAYHERGERGELANRTDVDAAVMKRIAAPMVGGMLTGAMLTLVVLPAIYSLWKEREVWRRS